MKPRPIHLAILIGGALMAILTIGLMVVNPASVPVVAAASTAVGAIAAVATLLGGRWWTARPPSPVEDRSEAR